MDKLVRITAIVREDCLPRITRGLKEVSATRFYVGKVRAMGSGVDLEEFRVSTDGGEAFTKNATIDILCDRERVGDLTEVIRQCAHTGHRGDGLIIQSEIESVSNIRTGERGSLALL